MLNGSLKNNDLLGLEVPTLFIQKSIIKHLFDPVDSFHTLLTCQSLNHQQLELFKTTLNWMIIFCDFLTNNNI